MSFNPFATIKNYSEMLNKIAIFNFISGIVILYLLGKYVPEIKSILASYEWNIQILNKDFTIINIIIPFLIALFSRMIKLHDRISDLFRIRFRYDINYILKPMALEINYSSNNLSEFLKKNRISLMRKCFYNYASTQDNKCEIELHYVHMTIDQLSWYWIILEIISLIFIAFIISLCYYTIILILIFGISLILSFILLFIAKYFCIKYTKIEVNLILEDTNRKNKIINNFYAL